MNKPRPHIERIAAADYDALLPQRLPSDVLDEGQPFTLLVREHDRAKNAYRVMINAAALKRQFGFVAFKTLLLDQDFRPASRHIDATMGQDNLWVGNMYIKEKDRSFRTPTGFIVPYEDVDDRSFLEAFDSIGASR